MRSLRAYLTVLVASVMLPGIVFGLGISLWLASEMRQAAEESGRRLTVQSAEVIADYIRSTTTAMKVLVRSPALLKGDFPELYKHAIMLGTDMGQHVGLADANGRQIFNTREPYGRPLPPRAEPTSYRRALQTGQPSVSNIILGAITKKPLITIDVPADSAVGPVVFGTSTDLAVIAKLMARTHVPDGWKVAVVDGDGRFIARNLHPEETLGKLAVPEVVAAARSSELSGTFRGRSLEGQEVVSFFHKVPGTPWTVLVGTPEPMLLAPIKQPLAMLAATGALAMGMTVLLAMVLSRRLHAAVGELTKATVALRHGDVPQPPAGLIEEFQQIGHMLHSAGATIKAKQGELVRARERAERSQAAKSRFFAAASHDLRQPLQAFGLFLEILRDTQPSPSQQRIVDQLCSAQGKMSELMNGLLDMAKLDAEGVRLSPCVMDLAALLADIGAECRPQAEAKGLDLRVHAPAPARLQADPMVLGRMVRNLVHNALRYTQHGGVLVALRRRRGALWIEVWDTGIGIPADKLELVWEEFYQVGDSGRDQAHGLGLGLSIVSRLAQATGTGISVCSRPGRGSRFRLTLSDGQALPLQ